LNSKVLGDSLHGAFKLPMWREMPKLWLSYKDYK
jgi:hypothetical protein